MNFFHDDSFFYMKTAVNLATGMGSTFDGINETNGYHPLWFGLLALTFTVMKLFVQLSPEVVMRVVFFVHLAFCAGILSVNFKLLSLIVPRGTLRRSFLILALALVIPVLIRDFGVESHPAILIISVYFLARANEARVSKSKPFLRAGLLALLFLARTDLLYSVIPALILAEVVTIRPEVRWREMAIVTLVTGSTAILYFVYNYLSYGYIFQISAAISNAFPDTVIMKNFHKLFYNLHNLLNITSRFLIVVLSAVVFVYRRNVYQREFSVTLLFACLGSVAFCCLHIVFNNYGLREWYITMPDYIALLILVLAFIQTGRFYKPVVAGLTIVAVVGFYVLRIDSDKFDSVYHYSQLLKQSTHESDRIFQTDFSGLTGFFSERKVVNGDGFINSFEYRDYVTSGRLNEYFTDYAITHYSTYTFNKPDQKGSTFRDFIAGIYIADYEAVIRRKNEVLQVPYSFRHGPSSYFGFWYLFKTGNGFQIRVIAERPG